LSNSQFYDVLTYNPELIRFEEVIYELEREVSYYNDYVKTI